MCIYIKNIISYEKPYWINKFIVSKNKIITRVLQKLYFIKGKEETLGIWLPLNAHPFQGADDYIIVIIVLLLV